MKLQTDEEVREYIKKLREPGFKPGIEDLLIILSLLGAKGQLDVIRNDAADIEEMLQAMYPKEGAHHMSRVILMVAASCIVQIKQEGERDLEFHKKMAHDWLDKSIEAALVQLELVKKASFDPGINLNDILGRKDG